MTRTRRFLRGLGVGYVSQIVLALVGLWVTRFLLGRLGQHDYGLWLVATQLLAYLMLADMGIVALLPREVAYAAGRGASRTSGPLLPDVVGLTVRILFWQLPLVGLAAAVLWLLLPSEWELLRGPLGVLLAAFLATYPLRVTPAILSGLQDLAFLGALQAGALLAGTVATVLLVLGGWGLTALAAGWVVTQMLHGVGALLRLWARFPEALPRSLPRPTLHAIRERIGGGAWVSLSQIAVVLLNATDVVIIGKVLGAAAVVPYTCTAKLIWFLANQPQLLMQGAQPGLAELRVSESPHRALQAATALTQAVLIVSGAIACGVMAVNFGFVQMWVGVAQWGGFTLTVVILARTLLAHWNTTTGSAIFAFGYERRLALVGIADGILFLALTPVLVGRLGPIGAPLAGILSVLLISLPFNLGALGRETRAGVPHLVASLWPWAWRFALAFGLSVAVARFWRPTSLPALLGAALLSLTAYGVLMVGRVLEPPLDRYLDARVLTLLRRLPRQLRRTATA